MANIGDIVKVNRKGLYYHYGILSGNDRVIHYTGINEDIPESLEQVYIIETSLSVFLKGGVLEVDDLDYDREECIKTARSFLGQNKFYGSYYNVISNNCEHFAYYCATKEHKSSQVNNVLNIIKSIFK
ncbi:MAG: lecithin retinol acyltransferase family protein [Acholeplasmatales bacterium]|nr:lecithin retinol acyltransferase family protein [Acholeplasmatales bacterium]